MAYIPTRADLMGSEQSVGYKPTRSDFMDPPKTQKTDEQKFADAPWYDKPSLSGRIQKAQLDQQSPFAPRSRPEEEKYWGTAEKVAGSLMDYAPFFMGATGITKLGAKALSKFPATAEGLAKFATKHPRLAKYIPESVAGAIGGAGYGAATAPEGEGLSSAAIQGGIGAAIPVVGGAVVDPLLRYGAKKYAQSAIPAFTEKAAGKIKELLPTSEYAKKMEQQYASAYGANKANWKSAENTAKELDENVLRGTHHGSKNIDERVGRGTLYDNATGDTLTQGPTHLSANKRGYFNNSSYKNYIDQFTKNAESLEPAMRVPYQQSMNVAENAKNLAPESFSGAMAARKNLNQNTSDYLKKEAGGNFNPQTRESKEFVKGLQGNLQNETLLANKGLVGEENLNQFKRQWEAANKSHQNLQKFYKTPEKMTGAEKSQATNTVRQAFKASLPESMGGQGIPLDPSMVGRYLPSLTQNGAQGVQGMKQLAKIIGSKKEAVEAAKAHIFRPQIENGAKTVDAAAKYGQLSPSQRKYLFGNSDEGKMLEAINKTRLAFGREPEKTLAKIGHGAMSLGIPGGLGFAAGLANGESWDKSLMTGLATAAASKGIKGLAGRTATPGSVNRAIRFGKNGTTNFGRNANYIGQSYMNTPPEGRR